MTTDTTTTEPICPQPPSEMLMSLNGFDEIAIAARFGEKIGDLRNDPITCGRALAFVHYRRRGEKDADAYSAAMTLTLHEVSHEFFAPEPKADEDDASAEGNDASA